MSTDLMWQNLVAYSLQVGLLIGLAAMAPALLRLRLPHARLWYWQILLVVCLLLPAVKPWRQTVLTVTTPAPVVRHQPANTPAVRPETPRRQWSTAEVGLLLLGAGMLARLGWLVAGFWKLRRYRRNSRPLELDGARFGAWPELRLSGDVSGPVTFGWRDPVVLLPRSFPALDAALQHGILCHEALHAERRDWLFTVAEELVRAAFWFHPAIWWLLGEIQLTREQVVDREVVQRTQAKESYLDALLAAAGASNEADLAPAPLFLKRRQLKKRVQTIVQEVAMPKARLIPVFAASLLLAVSAAWFAGEAFPLAAEPQTVADGLGVTVDMQGAQMMHRNPVTYPADAIKKGVHGTVVAQVRLAADGTVVDASIVSGPDELRRAVLESVLAWHFQKDYAGSTHQVTVQFALPPAGAAPVGLRASIVPDAVPGPESANSAVVKSITVRGLSDSVRDQVLSAIPVHEGETLTPEAMERVRAAVRSVDEHLSLGQLRTKDGVTILVGAPLTSPIGSGGLAGVLVADRQTVTGAAPAPRDAAPAAPARVQIGSNVQASMLISGDRPVYPALAKQARISGVVHLHAIIARDGFVSSLSIIPPAHPLLAPAALEAVRRWQYRPTLLNGQPVEVETTIDVSFTLAEDNN